MAKTSPKITFETIRIHYSLPFEMRIYQPGKQLRYQIVDGEGNPLTEYILAGEMNHYLKGLGEGLRHGKTSN